MSTLDKGAALSAAAQAARDRALARTDVTHEIVAPWVIASVVVIEPHKDDRFEALQNGLIEQDGYEWLGQWFNADPRHGGPIRCFAPAELPQGLASHVADLQMPALFVLSHEAGARSRISIHPPEPEPVATVGDEQEIAIALSGPHEDRESGSWLFLAACAPWENRADLTGVGATPGKALAALGEDLDRHLSCGGWTASIKIAKPEPKKEAAHG